MATAIPSGTAGMRADAFMTRVVVLVDEATEPALPEEEASRRRADLVNMANSHGAGASGSTAGVNIAYAIRKRLKSDDSAAVMNTLKLLDELMRSCPYFYRYVADDKMFRRLWRFVVPDYKNGVRSMLPFTHRGRTATDLRATAGRPDIAIKVLILIRAWAEELSVLYNGRYDPSAGFLIERYNSKRVRIKFPDVPKTELPWVCPVGQNTRYNSGGGLTVGVGSSSSGARPNKGAPNLPESLSLAEVENTVNLFENMIDKATDITELRSDVTKELANRCRLIFDNIDRLSMSMDKEEELTRAIRVSEKLRRSLSSYDDSIRSGNVVKPVPIVSSSRVLDSDDDTYDNSRMASSSAGYRSDHSEDAIVPRKHQASSSHRAPPDLPRPPTSRSKRSAHRSLDRSHSHDSHLNALASNRLDDFRDGDLTPRERREEAQRKFHRDYVASKRPSDQPPRRERSASSSPTGMADSKRKGSKSKRRDDREQEKDEIRPQEEETVSSSKKTHESGKKKSSKRDLKKNNSIFVAAGSSSGTKSGKKSKDKSSGKKLERSMSALPGATTLVDLGGSDQNSVETDSSSDAAKKDDIFALLGERYGTGKSKSSESSQERNIQADNDQALQQISEGMQGVNFAAQQPAMNMYQSTNPAAMPYGSVMMMPPPIGMPNPMAMSMYGSVNPMMQQNPAALYSAYNTINPAMYYNSVNPMAYATQNPGLGMGAPFANPFMQQQVPQQMQQPQQQMQQPHAPPQQMQQPQAPPQQMSQYAQPPQPHPASSQAPPAFQQQRPQMYQSPDLASKSFALARAASLPPIQRAMTPMTQAASPPPPPAPAMYTTVTNAPAPPPNSVPPPPMPASYTTVTNAPAPPPNTAPPAMDMYQSVNMGAAAAQAETAAAFQATMANAAAMYNAAAAAYQSVSGHAPLQAPPMQAPMMMPMPHPQQQQPMAHPPPGPFGADNSGVRAKQ